MRGLTALANLDLLWDKHWLGGGGGGHVVSMEIRGNGTLCVCKCVCTCSGAHFKSSSTNCHQKAIYLLIGVHRECCLHVWNIHIYNAHILLIYLFSFSLTKACKCLLVLPSEGCKPWYLVWDQDLLLSPLGSFCFCVGSATDGLCGAREESPSSKNQTSDSFIICLWCSIHSRSYFVMKCFNLQFCYIHFPSTCLVCFD